MYVHMYGIALDNLRTVSVFTVIYTAITYYYQKIQFSISYSKQCSVHTYVHIWLSISFCDMVLCVLQLEAELIVELLKDYPEAKAWVCFNCKVSRFSECIHVCMYMHLTHTFKLLYNSHHLPVLHSLEVCCYLRMTAKFHFLNNI